MLDEFSDKEMRVIRRFERALKDLHNLGCYIHNCYGHLNIYQKGTVRDVIDGSDMIDCHDAGIEIKGEIWSQWTDDRHYVILTEKGKKILAELELDEEE
jgi:hypothetical protein